MNSNSIENKQENYSSTDCYSNPKYNLNKDDNSKSQNKTKLSLLKSEKTKMKKKIFKSEKCTNTTTSLKKKEHKKSNKILNDTNNPKFIGLVGINKEFDKIIDIKKKIGSGSSGDSYIGVLRSTNRKLVVKHIQKDSKLFKNINENSFKNTVLNEITIQHNCGNRNILKSLGYFSLGSNSYALILEYASQGNLKEFLYNLKLNAPKSNIKSKPYFSESLVGYLSYHLLMGLKHLYLLDVVHIAFKPENILVLDNYDLKIADFGISVKLNCNYDKYVFSSNGTKYYMAPENINRESVPLKESHKNDYYSFGVIIYKLIYNKYPYDINSNDSYEEQYMKIKNNKLIFPSEVNVSSELKNLISGLLKFDYRDRFGLEEIFQNQWMKKFLTVNLVKELYKDNKNFIGDLYNDNIDLTLNIFQ